MAAVILKAFLLALAMSADAFVSGLAYGASKIKVSFSACIAISVICSSLLAVSLFFAKAIERFVPARVSAIVCGSVLILIGAIKLFSFVIKRILQNKKNILLAVAANPEKADLDNTKTLSIKEAALIAIVTSLDGVATGAPAALASPSYAYSGAAVAFSFVFVLTFVMLGELIGRKIARHTKFNLSWLCGFILIGLGIWQIV